MTPLPAFCMPWHTSVSNAFQEILVDPLREFLPINLVPWDQDPRLPLRYYHDDPQSPLIFCQLPPPPELLRENSARIVWLPMWDNIAKWPHSFWAGLPKQLRIVAYSAPVRRLAEQFALPVLPVHFFLDPDRYQPVPHDGQRTMLYWNRVGLYSPRALLRICQALDIQRLIHIHRPDPGYDHPALNLPDTLASTEVVTIRSFLPDAEHARLLDQSTLCLGPRPFEGVGLAVLQSMARGACVLAYDGPATNEYVIHGRNGHLFRAYSKTMHKWRKSLGKRWHHLVHRHQAYHYHMVSAGQVGNLAGINPEALGRTARSDHEHGYQLWQQGLKAYAEFITSW
ncbi:glycosyltransferase [Desulfonatronum parangueonense]